MAALVACGGDAREARDASADVDVSEVGADSVPAIEIAAEVSTNGDASEVETSETVEVAPTPSKLGLDYDQLPRGARANYAPLDAPDASWLDRPWPSDAWRHEATPTAPAHLDLGVLPLPNEALFDAYVEVGEHDLTGFGLNSAGFVAFDAPLDGAGLPDPRASRDDPRASVQLLEMGAHAARHPIELRLYDGVASRWLPEHTLAFRPVHGLPLAAGTTYCLVITRGLRDAAGHHLDQPPAFAAELASGSAGLAPLTAWLASDEAALAPIDLAAATCFTTDTPLADLWSIRAYLATTPAPTPSETNDLGPQHPVSGAVVEEYRGRYLAPNFQRGESPYDAGGGEFVFDASHQPLVQLVESMRYLLWVPSAPPPASGYPIVVYAHGTGGDYTSCTHDYDAGAWIAAARLALICIDQPTAGERGGGTNQWADFTNPRAARTTLRQSAIDVLSLVRGIRAGHFDVAGAHFDPARVLFFGHSQGALTASLALAVVPELRAGVVSSGGGLIGESVLGRADWQPFLPGIAVVFDEDPANLDGFHPIIAVLQMLGEAADPINYAPLWLRPVDGFAARHVLTFAGTADPYTPWPSALALSAAGGLPLAVPAPTASLAHELVGLAPIELPAHANLTTPDGARTGVTIAVDGGDHFVAYGAPYLTAWARFLESAADTETPTVDLDAPPF